MKRLFILSALFCIAASSASPRVGLWVDVFEKGHPEVWLWPEDNGLAPTADQTADVRAFEALLTHLNAGQSSPTDLRQTKIYIKKKLPDEGGYPAWAIEKSSYGEIAQIFSQCKYEGSVLLAGDQPIPGRTVFGAQYLCTGRHNTPPYGFISIVFENHVLKGLYAFPDQPELVTMVSPDG